MIQEEIGVMPYGIETDSFLNVFSKGAGQPPHTHLRSQDKFFDLGKINIALLLH